MMTPPSPSISFLLNSLATETGKGIAGGAIKTEAKNGLTMKLDFHIL